MSDTTNNNDAEDARWRHAYILLDNLEEAIMDQEPMMALELVGEIESELKDIE